MDRESASYQERQPVAGIVKHAAHDFNGQMLVAQVDYRAFQGEAKGPLGYHFLMVLNGGGRFAFDYNGVKFDDVISTGDFGIRLPGDKAKSVWPDARLLQIGIAADLFDQYLDDACEGGKLDLEQLASQAYSSYRIRQYLSLIAQDNIRDENSRLCADNNLANLAGWLVDSQSPPNKIVREQPLSSPKWKRVNERVQDDPDNPPTVAELAQLAGLSRHHFCRTFQQKMFCTPSEFIIGVRMKNAARRLRETGETVLSISLESGYANPSKFAAAFRRQFGLSPTQWRAL